jgi:hypothetical protein
MLKSENINKRGDFGETLLMQAVLQGNQAAVGLLIQNGADVHLKDYGGETALHMAARKGYTAIVKQLLDAGVAVNVQDVEGWTPLMRAVTEERADIVGQLLSRGADIVKKNSDNETAIERAVVIGNPQVLSVLMRSSAMKYPTPLIESAIDHARSRAAQLGKPEIEALFESRQVVLSRTKPTQLGEMPWLRAGIEEKSSEKVKQVQLKPMPKGLSNERFYELQVGTYSSEERATYALNEFKKKFYDVLKGYNYHITQAHLGTDQRDVKYRVRVGYFNNYDAAGDTCDSLKDKEGSCFVVDVTDDVKSVDAPKHMKAQQSQPLDAIPVQSQLSGPHIPPLASMDESDEGMALPVMDEVKSELAAEQSPSDVVMTEMGVGSETMPGGDRNKVEFKEELVAKSESYDLPWVTDRQNIGRQDVYQKTLDMDKGSYLSFRPKMLLESTVPQKSVVNPPKIEKAPKVVREAEEEIVEVTEVADVIPMPEDVQKITPVAPQPIEMSVIKEKVVELSPVPPVPSVSHVQPTSSDPLVPPAPRAMSEPIQMRDMMTKEMKVAKQKQVAVPVAPPKISREEFIKKMKKMETVPDTKVSEAVLVPDELTKADEKPSNMLPEDYRMEETPKNHYKVGFFPSEKDAVTYWDRMFAYDEKYHTLSAKPASYPQGTALIVGPVVSQESLAQLCTSIKENNLICYDRKDNIIEAEMIPEQTKSGVFGQQQGNIASVSSKVLTQKSETKNVETWIELGAFSSGAEAEYYWMFLNEDHKDIFASLQFSIKPMKDHSLGKNASSLRAGPFEDKQIADSLCRMMQMRKVTCFVSGSKK